jgi:hypothetical protein
MVTQDPSCSPKALLLIEVQFPNVEVLDHMADYRRNLWYFVGRIQHADDPTFLTR